jgi:hypothetical protein
MRPEFLERGELLHSRGGFVLRELAVRWAEREAGPPRRDEGITNPIASARGFS